MQAASESTPARLATPPFVLAVALLAIGAVLAGPVSAWKKLKGTKSALPLQRSLSTLDVEALSPYRIVERIILEPTIVEALGTDQYLNWILEDTSLPEDDPLRYVSLLITYYSGGADLVPHTPDVCFLGFGYEPAQPHENTRINVASLHPYATTVPIRVCTFMKTAVFQRAKHSVVYSFICNGRFVGTRTAVRLLINDPRNVYAYFSKVEVSFPGATRSQTVEGAKKLFERVLPVLLRDHIPDFEAAEKAANEGCVSAQQFSAAGLISLAAHSNQCWKRSG